MGSVGVDKMSMISRIRERVGLTSYWGRNATIRKCGTPPLGGKPTIYRSDTAEVGMRKFGGLTSC